MGKPHYVQVESKNALLELLKAGKTFDKIFLANNAYKDPKTAEILSEAGKRHVPVIKSARRLLKRKSRTGALESVIGLMLSENNWDLDDLLTEIFSKKMVPFFLIVDHIKYAQNIGAILRTAYASGVNGVILPVQKNSFVDSEVMRISMGASERVPLVEMNLFDAIKQLKDSGVKIASLDMEGKTYYENDLKGPIAIILGAEDVGISSKLLERSDIKLSIPMREGIGSLNVSVSAGVICYEKLRQEVA
jgi:23S rRNA (guanosine2251-2'-O)-methyltransferase